MKIETFAYLRREKSAEVINPVKKLFIANRGEIAVRAIKACQEMGISAVAAYSPQDHKSLATRMAGSEMEINANWGLAPIASYLDMDGILKQAIKNNCDAIFLGYGFLSENPKFIKNCKAANMKVLSPPAETMELAADKIKAKKIAKRLGIPVMEGTENLPDLASAIQASSKLNFPVILKLPDGGGGMGNRVARNREELINEYKKLKGNSSNGEIFMEPFIENAAHVEVQIAADKYGNVISLGERDCTAQRRHQKIIEESPSPHITPQMGDKMQEAAIKFAERIGYQGVGTWEFIIDKDKSSTESVLDKQQVDGSPFWYFMEINPRIQVEHGVTEKQTGIDIVELMIQIAEGKHLSITQDKIKSKGHTIEVRLYAENPFNNFSPSPGTISKLALPEDSENSNIRVETGVRSGDEMSAYFDPLIAKIIAHGETREEARINLLKYLYYKVRIEGDIETNQKFLTHLLSSAEFIEGNITTDFAEELAGKLAEGFKALNP